MGRSFCYGTILGASFTHANHCPDRDGRPGRLHHGVLGSPRPDPAGPGQRIGGLLSGRARPGDAVRLPWQRADEPPLAAHAPAPRAVEAGAAGGRVRALDEQARYERCMRVRGWTPTRVTSY